MIRILLKDIQEETEVWRGRKDGNVDRDCVKFLGLWSFTTLDLGENREFSEFRKDPKYLPQK